MAWDPVHSRFARSRSCHVIDTVVIIWYRGWYCYRYFFPRVNFCNLWYTWCRPVLIHCQSRANTPWRHELMTAHIVPNANSTRATMMTALMNPIIWSVSHVSGPVSRLWLLLKWICRWWSTQCPLSQHPYCHGYCYNVVGDDHDLYYHTYTPR